MQSMPIEKLCIRVSSGGTPSRKRPEFYTEDNRGHLWVKSKELLDRSIYDTEEKISEEGLQRSSAKYFPEKTILIAMYGANVGQLGLLRRPATVNQAICGMVVNPKIVDPLYLFYALLHTRSSLTVKAQGAAQQNLNQGLIKEFYVPTPSLHTQQKIASILSAYDDLIENNLRRIKILEEMAQNLYREWFVKFRFPGYEDVKFVDSPLGKIPGGWAVKTVEDTFRILGGGTPSKKEPEYWKEGSIDWYTPSDLTASKTMFIDQSSNRINELGLAKSSARLFPSYSVMMTSRATLGVLSINTTEASTNQGFITCIPNDRFPLHVLFYWLKENTHLFINLGTGATFKEITKGVFKTIELLIPASEVVVLYENTVKPMSQEILNLTRRNNILRQTRDLLLPRLISGELDVSELNIEVPEDTA